MKANFARQDQRIEFQDRVINAVPRVSPREWGRLHLWVKSMQTKNATDYPSHKVDLLYKNTIPGAVLNNQDYLELFEFYQFLLDKGYSKEIPSLRAIELRIGKTDNL